MGISVPMFYIRYVLLFIIIGIPYTSTEERQLLKTIRTSCQADNFCEDFLQLTILSYVYLYFCNAFRVLLIDSL